MYAKKAKPSHLLDFSDFIIVFPLEGEQQHSGTWNQIVAIDPGKKNLALVVERRHNTGQIETLAHTLVELDQQQKTEQSSQSKDKGLKLRYDKLYVNIMDLVITHKDLLRNSHWILIEKQLPENTDACIVMTTCMTAILSVIADAPNRPYLALMSPMLKTQILAPGLKMDKRERKKWAVEYGRELANRANDVACQQLLACPRKYVYATKTWKKTTKCDDLADIKCMIEAFCVLQGLVLTPSPLKSIEESSAPQVVIMKRASLPVLNINPPADQLRVVQLTSTPTQHIQFVLQGQVLNK